ncbi:DUF3800 domain-containing protein [Pectobacterium sp. IFB5596]|uniref:DUF3800 domain-containing protein n=1 Tax=Pectobacterium sp. IFB5596 TaxID=1839803 RepID=UPI001F44A6A5|nr:DUF3800 domain-containing protein [Pectobacterium sp. IFB5596]MCE9732359.1 hypothetical protein [Pectobacterium sp. IFB5596]
MECFRIDESGYTGFDLLNTEQQFQGATAIAIEDDEARRLIREHFPKLQADELKYRSLARRPTNHPRLLALQKDLLTHYKCITYVCNKRYLLLLMFLDYAVEPFYYKRGQDFYVDGQNYTLASFLYTVGPMLFGREAFSDLQVAFQHAVKEKSLQALGDLVQAARNTRWQELPETLGPLARYAAPECLQAIATPGVSTDAAMVVLQSLISRMEVIADGAYRVDHDESITFRETEITSITFPLKLQSVTQVDSKSSPAVQLADVMIGAAIEAANTLTGQRCNGGLDAQAVLALYEEHQLIHMLPSTDFDEQKRFRQGTQASEIIDYFASHFQK